MNEQGFAENCQEIKICPAGYKVCRKHMDVVKEGNDYATQCIAHRLEDGSYKNVIYLERC